MNGLISAIHNRDSAALARMAGEPKRERVVNENAEKLVDALFENLLRLFPAARHTVLATPDDVVAMKRQWIMAFVENGITNVEQVRAGMRMARQQETDFWPSCGKFIGWCRDSQRGASGLPTDDEVMAEFRRYGRDKHLYPTPEEFPWKHHVMYWVVLDVRRLMYQHNYTEAEVIRSIRSCMRKWERDISAGMIVPEPVKQLADKRRPSAAIELLEPEVAEAARLKGAALLARIRARVSGMK